MKLRNLLLASLLILTAMVSAQEMPPIPVDNAVRIGKLDNGLTYYIRHNEWPEQKANFYIAQRVGSIQENDDQRGLAHFLEHMAFNGSEHFPDSTLLEYTRSLGVEFGSNLNAYTSIDQTVYRICDVPTKREAALDSCILILKDWSNGLTLDDKEIDKERGVIHQEWQLNEGPGQRMYQKLLPKLYPNSKYGERLPIGLMEIIDNFPYQALRDYYKKWYRPDNQAIIVVGDVDVDHVESVIKNLWAGVTVPADAAKVVDELVGDNDEPIYVIEKDKEQQYSIVSLLMKHEPVPAEMKGRLDYLMDQYVKRIIEMMIDQRMQDESLKADCPFVNAGGGDGQYILSKTMDAFQMQGLAKEDKSLETLAALYREVQRVKKHGFTQSEFDRCKEEYLSRLEKQYTNRNKIKNAQFGDSYRDHFLENEPIPSIEDKYQVMKDMIVPNIPLDIVNMYAKELISDQDKNLVAFIMEQEKDGKTYPTEEQMAETINGVRAENIEAFVDNAKNEPLILPENMPAKGKIKKEKENTVFGYKELTLSNGARVILKKTDFKDDEVQFQALAKGGKGYYGGADIPTLKVFDAGISACGLGNFSNNELDKALYGKQASVSIGLDKKYQSLGGSCVPKDIETLMQLVYLNFTALKEDPEAYGALKSQLEILLKNKSLSPEMAFSDSLSTTLYAHDVRELPLTLDDIDAASQARMIEMVKERFANAADFVFYFIGNIDETQIRPLIEQYIASLPSQKKATSTYQDWPTVATGENINKFYREMTAPKAISFDIWHNDSPYNLETSILADAAGQILEMVYLKDIREDASAAYSVGASGVLRRSGDKSKVLLQYYCPMDPNKADQALGLLAKGLADNTITVDQDKVNKVKENMLKNADEFEKSNSHWMDVIDEYIWTGVDMHHGYREIVNSLTPQKIADYLKALVAAGNHISVVMLPAEKKAEE